MILGLWAVDGDDDFALLIYDLLLTIGYWLLAIEYRATAIS